MTKACDFYKRGAHCNRGRSCPFSHDLGASKRPQICVYFRRGHCAYGDMCPKQHEPIPDKASQSSSTKSDSSIQETRPDVPVPIISGWKEQSPGSTSPSTGVSSPCFFFTAGVCTQDPCPFSHALDGVVQEPPKPPPPPLSPPDLPTRHSSRSSSKIVCNHFLSGHCVLGDKCKLSHAQVDTNLSVPTSPAVPDQPTFSPTPSVHSIQVEIVSTVAPEETDHNSGKRGEKNQVEDMTYASDNHDNTIASNYGINDSKTRSASTNDQFERASSGPRVTTTDTSDRQSKGSYINSYQTRGSSSHDSLAIPESNYARSQTNLPPLQSVDEDGRQLILGRNIQYPHVSEIKPHWSQFADPHADQNIPFCKALAQGLCNQGDTCQFRHSLTVNEYTNLFQDKQPNLWTLQRQSRRLVEQEPTENHNYQDSRINHSSALPTTKSCTFYPLGKCRNAKNCPYYHDLSINVQPPQNSERSERLCRYFTRGSCAKGSACPYLHDTSQDDGQFAAMADQPADADHDNGWGNTQDNAQDNVWTGTQDNTWDNLQDNTWDNPPKDTWDNTGGQSVPSRPDKKRCRIFAAEGYCKFGDRCRYSHGEEEDNHVVPDGGDEVVEKNSWGTVDWGVHYQPPQDWPEENVPDDNPKSPRTTSSQPVETDEVDLDGDATRSEDRVDDKDTLDEYPKHDISDKDIETVNSNHQQGDVQCNSPHVVPKSDISIIENPPCTPPSTNVEPLLVTEHPLVERIFSNCTVQYGPGSIPLQILTGFHTNRIVLHNLPFNVAPSDVEALVSPFGTVTSVISVAEDEDGDASSIEVAFFGGSEAKQAALHLHGQTFDSRLIRAELDTNLSLRVNSQSESCVVKLTWVVPSSMAWVAYKSISVSKGEAVRLNGFLFRGRKIQAEFQTGPRRNDGHSYVCIHGLPTDVSEDAVAELCPGNVLVTIVKPSVQYPDETVLVRETLEQFGTLERLDMHPMDSKCIAFGRYSTPESAAEAAKQLDGLSKDELGPQALSAKLSFFCQYSLPVRLINVLLPELKRLRDANVKSCKLKYFTDADPGLVCIYGPVGEITSFSRVSLSLESLLRGELIVIDHMPWDAYFDTPSSHKVLEKLNSDSNFFIACDSRAQTIRAFGDAAKRELGKNAIKRLLKKVRASQQEIDLDRRSLHGLLNGGLEALHNELGPNKVTLDVVTPKLVVRGDASVLETVLEKVSLNVNDTTPSIVDFTQADSRCFCTVCLRECDELIKLSCRHCYCMKCLQHVLRSAASAQYFPLTCVAELTTADGESTRCSTCIPHHVVLDLLKMAELEVLLEQAYLDYVRAHHETYLFCPSYFCKGILEYCDEGFAVICPLCSAEICCYCGTFYHVGLSCSDHQRETAVYAQTQ